MAPTAGAAVGPTAEVQYAEAVLLPITIAFGVAPLAAGAIRLLNLWLNGRLAGANSFDLICEVYGSSSISPTPCTWTATAAI